MGRRGRVVAVSIVAMSVVSLLGACAPGPPGTSTEGEAPGAPGPCNAERTSIVNPGDRRFSITLLEPTGASAAPGGGTCDDSERPLAVVAHGYLGVFDFAYAGLLNHLVSRGFVVVFPAWPIEYDPDKQYDVVDTGARLAVETSGRVDLDRVGFVGHSYGGGMLPWLLRQAAARGWGSEALWATALAPWFSMLLPDGPIEVPSHTRYTTVHYRDDVLVDARIGIEVLDSLTIPRSQRLHLTTRTDQHRSPILSADHLGPVSFELPWLGTLSTDALDLWAWRVIDATASCSLEGRWCDADLTEIGTWPDGQSFRAAIASRYPVDSGPPALQECTFFLNPRPCRAVSAPDQERPPG